MATVPYCTYDDLVMRYGTANVHKWADMDNNQNPTQIKARVDWACIQAADDLNDDLRGSRYDVPFEPSTLPGAVKDKATQKTACILYSLRGITDMGANNKPVDRMAAQLADYELWVRKIWACTITLEIASVSRSYPTPIIDNGDNCFVQGACKDACDTPQRGIDPENPFDVIGNRCC